MKNEANNKVALITGASGGVGSAAVQLAKVRGARVIAVTSPEKSAAVTELGAEVFSNVVKQIERRDVAPLVAERFPLEQIADAQNAFMSKKHIGKIVLTVSDHF